MGRPLIADPTVVDPLDGSPRRSLWAPSDNLYGEPSLPTGHAPGLVGPCPSRLTPTTTRPGASPRLLAAAPPPTDDQAARLVRYPPPAEEGKGRPAAEGRHAIPAGLSEPELAEAWRIADRLDAMAEPWPAPTTEPATAEEDR